MSSASFIFMLDWKIFLIANYTLAYRRYNEIKEVSLRDHSENSSEYEWIAESVYVNPYSANRRLNIWGDKFISLSKHMMINMCFDRLIKSTVKRKRRKITLPQNRRQNEYVPVWTSHWQDAPRRCVQLLPMKYYPSNKYFISPTWRAYSRATNIAVGTDVADWTATTPYRYNDTSAESSLSVKSVARQTAVRADAGKVELLWSGFANCRSLSLYTL